MKHTSRREVLKGFGMATALLATSDAPRAVASQPPPQASVALAPPAAMMAIAAQPGDAVFTMGAAIGQQIQGGGKGIFFSLTHGERGNPAVAPSTYGAMQIAATQKAAGILGAQSSFLSYPDGELPDNEEARLAVCDAIRQYRPAIVITHWKGSMHKDHRACYHIVTDAIFYAGLPGLKSKLPAHSVATLLFAENWEDAEGFRQDLYLDVSDVFARWMRACAAFPMWRGETGFRYDVYYSSLAAARGALASIGQKRGARFKYAVALMFPHQWVGRAVRSLTAV